MIMNLTASTFVLLGSLRNHIKHLVSLLKRLHAEVTWLGFVVRGRPRDYRERDHPTFPGLELSSAFQPSPDTRGSYLECSSPFQLPDNHSPHCHHVKQKNHQQVQSILISQISQFSQNCEVYNIKIVFILSH